MRLIAKAAVTLVIKEGWTKNKYYPGQATCKIEIEIKNFIENTH